MTLQKHIENYLESMGMFRKDAETVFGLLRDDPDSASLSERWQDNAEGYTDALLLTIRVRANATAIQWIDANCPEAWFRPMFAEEEAR